MKTSLLLAPAVVLVLAGLAGCAPAATGSVTPITPVTPVPPLPRVVRLGQDASGRAINLNVGDTLEITLPGNPSTGYTWQPLIDPWPTLLALGQPSFLAQGTGLGAGGLVTLSYQAVQPGTVDLSLLYGRPSSPPDPNAQEFDLTVSVQ
ncbi:protease inhibitor I42 family protein [Deinococcus planocerae]|uniref:protease inhibitor I42 family protein n=1 Tax=Deinococcus planocerae TaxID=1737569 RepID=UPI000C7EB15A|nr:protease inhibitor I42 family protein [Deinococcus planocerae]